MISEWFRDSAGDQPAEFMSQKDIECLPACTITRARRESSRALEHPNHNRALGVCPIGSLALCYDSLNENQTQIAKVREATALSDLEITRQGNVPLWPNSSNWWASCYSGCESRTSSSIAADFGVGDGHYGIIIWPLPLDRRWRARWTESSISVSKCQLVIPLTWETNYPG